MKIAHKKKYKGVEVKIVGEASENVGRRLTSKPANPTDVSIDLDGRDLGHLVNFGNNQMITSNKGLFRVGIVNSTMTEQMN